MLWPQEAAKGRPGRGSVHPSTLSYDVRRGKGQNWKPRQLWTSLLLDTQVLWTQGGIWRCLTLPGTVGSAPGPLKPQASTLPFKSLDCSPEVLEHQNTRVLLSQTHFHPSLILALYMGAWPIPGKASLKVVELAEQLWACQLPASGAHTSPDKVWNEPPQWEKPRGVWVWLNREERTMSAPWLHPKPAY